MNKKRFSIIMQLSSIFIIVIGLLLSVLGYVIYHFKNSGEATGTLVTHTAVQLNTVKSARLQFTEALLDMRGFLFYPDGANIYEQGYHTKIKKSSELAHKYNDNSTLGDAKNSGAKLAKLVDDYIVLGDKVIAAKKNNDPNLNQLTTEGRQLVQAITAQFVEVDDLQQKYMDDRGIFLSDNAKSETNTAIIVSSVISVAVILLVIWYSRSITRRLKNISTELAVVGSLTLNGEDLHPLMNDEIGDMGTIIINMKKALNDIVLQIADGSQTLTSASEGLSHSVSEQLKAVETVAESVTAIAAGSSQNADNISHISATIQEISASSEEINASTAEVNISTQNAVAEAAKGMDMLIESVAQNESISRSMNEITAVTGKLDQGSEKIKGIVDLINSIAGQTNLLALNAAIEAARAGEAGRGFAVVAEEVRKLAEQSASATRDITLIINDMSAEINFAVKTVQQANREVDKGKEVTIATQKGFDVIMEKMSRVKSGIEHIANAVSETTQGIQTMVDSVENISTVAYATSSSAETVAASAEEQTAGMHEIDTNAASLSGLAAGMMEVVKRFKV
ncbi:methyl-accepting chemotaxis protein [Pelosinus sp. sgz500959]|uniref:methyl-accepting chemotaxis protein n=1 Tax=Pelosinus sp. sgz500959 TaxID=3242472 RepID=UPI00366D097C